LRTPFAIAVMAFSLALTATATVPAGFTDALVTTFTEPTALAFTPDGRLLIASQPGVLRVYQNGALLPTAALTFSASQICHENERGLLGVTVDPEFATNRYIYVYYTARKFGSCALSTTDPNAPVNRVSRFVLPDGNIVDPATETILVDGMPSPSGNHNAGDVQFGKDGYLYITVGDGAVLGTSRLQHVLAGKVLRVTRDGAIPPTNPFQGAGTARCSPAGSTTAGQRCQETFAWGLRNPFRLAFDPNAAGTIFRINDVGQNTWEEIDAGQSGVDYGWNCREGAHTFSTTGACNPTPAGMVDPIFEYAHGVQVPGTSSPTNCNAITGGAFVPNGIWPGFDDSYLFGDLVCGAIFELTGSGPYTASDFASSLGSGGVVAMVFGPFGRSQALYYTSYAGAGQVRRISFDAPGNQAPSAVAGASPLGGALPLNVTFSAAGSTDPDTGDTLTYFWTFGDGTPETSTTSLTIAHTYVSAGVFTASLRVRDNHFAFSMPATVTVQAGNRAPTPTITSPAAGSTFVVGQTITLTGSATDPEDGALPASALSWSVVRHHDTHTHPDFGPASGNNLPITAPPPEDFASTQNSYLEVFLTATDTGGLSATVSRNVLPVTVPLTFQTDPPGLQLSLNGLAITTPQTLVSWSAWSFEAEAQNQSSGGNTYLFSSWSDGGARVHTVTTPASPATYTASFTVGTGSLLYTLTPCRLLDTRATDGPLGGPALSANVPRSFPVRGVCGIPETASAIVVNATITQPGAAGDLQLFAAGSAVPTTSVLSFGAGVTRAGASIVKLGDGGGVSALFRASSGTAHFILDVSGYFQ